MTFKQKVRAMSAKQIIMAMVEGLENPTTDFIKMSTWGHKDSKGVCYGCAATNAICRIAGKNFEYNLQRSDDEGSTRILGSIEEDNPFISTFENAIDSIRCGSIDSANEELAILRLPQIRNYKGYDLPALQDENYLELLHHYVALADRQ
jgi:hypothetical protein